MWTRCGNAPSCCSRFALRNAALMFYGKHASRRPEVGDYSFTVHRDAVPWLQIDNCLWLRSFPA
jgi:hypothetical protein